MMSLAVSGTFRARWTDAIHSEWIENLLANDPRRARAGLERCRDLMNAVIPDCLITGYEELIPTLQLPDAEDRHVLAAAIHGGVAILVTSNTRDFPAELLAHYGIERFTPDEFAEYLLDNDPQAVWTAFRAQRARLKNPPLTAMQLIDRLANCGLKRTADRLRAVAEEL